jgi:predicted nucleic acid-binding protein
MNDRVFLDTNILIYLYSISETQKRDVVYQVIHLHYCVTGLQALNEASNVWFKKYGWDGAKIHYHLDNIEALCDELIAIRRNTINLALSLKDSYGYSYYDCLMLASALESSCNAIMTEDMSDGQIINGQLKIKNPFANLS